MKALRLPMLAAFLVVCAHEGRAITIITSCQPLTSGVYALNADVSAPANSPCFTIAGDNVTLNLGGHNVYGSAGAAAITDGGIARRAITVSSGTLYVDIGVDLFASTEVRVDSLNVDSGAGPAIAVGAYSKVFANLVAIGGAATGIKAQCPSMIVWNNILFGPNTIVETGKGCKDIDNAEAKK